MYTKVRSFIKSLFLYILSRCLEFLPLCEQLMYLMKNRRSIMPYKFTEKEIENVKIKKLIECANYAPNHKLTYPWRFVVIDKASHHKLHQLTYDIMKNHYDNDPCVLKKLKELEEDVKDRWKNVSHFIGICVKKSHKVPEWEEICAVSCAVQNMLLMAPCLGIACYWSSWHSETTTNPTMLEFLGMSMKNEDICLGFLVLGYANSNILYERKSISYEENTKWI